MSRDLIIKRKKEKGKSSLGKEMKEKKELKTKEMDGNRKMKE